ncbi:MAG: beta-aspartyl-peptidase [Synergistaceae bacterium]|jgi:beta-aspartyl-dipeptidase (metallo-type)|nr:beta-aspartyl-peptidase [Synergistaceae bacterium]
MLWIQNGNVYAPKALGVCDILAAERKIAGIFPQGTLNAEVLRVIDPELSILDARGRPVVPGIVDRHVHFNGAGGEGGPRFRTPPLQLSAFIEAGVTSAVGLLGTDGTCRSLRELLMKARGLEDEGISTWIYTGSYSVPSVTLTGDVMSDICLIDKVIGLKMAISDHRSSHPSAEEIRRAVSDARTGGILSGKCGVVCVHMGSEKTSLTPLLQAIEDTDIPLTQYGPTHITRCESLLRESAAFGKRGGNLDVTAETEKDPIFGKSTRQALRFLLDGGVPPERITLSSDGNGSMPVFDEQGKMTGMAVGSISTVLETLLSLWDDPELGGQTILGMCTSNAASQLGLKGKGQLEKGADADLLVLGDKKLLHVVAKGQVLMRDGAVLKRGTFEPRA